MKEDAKMDNGEGYYSSLIPAAGTTEAVYVNDKDALALNQFQEKFGLPFVQWASEPSANLEEILKRQKLFKWAVDTARDDAKRDFILTLSEARGDIFEAQYVVQDLEDNFWKYCEKLASFLSKEKELPVQLSKLMQEISANSVFKGKEKETLRVIYDTIKETVSSAGILEYRLGVSRDSCWLEDRKGKSITLSFDKYPIISSISQKELKGHEKVADDIVTRRITKAFFNDFLEGVFSKDCMKPLNLRKLDLEVAYCYSEGGLDFKIFVTDKDGPSEDFKRLKGIDAFKQDFLDREEQLITNKFGFEHPVSREHTKNPFKLAYRGAAYLAKGIWELFPGSKSVRRRKARETVDSFIAKTQEIEKKQHHNLYIAKVQEKLDEALNSPEMAEAKEKLDISLKDNIKRDTVYHALEKCKEKIKECYAHRTAYVNAVRELKNIVNVASEYVQLEEQGLHLCFPEIAPKESKKTKMKNLYPLRLYAADKKTPEIVPSNVEVNGNPLVITGENGGGKSIYLYSIADAILQAQTGLPILADEAELSVVEGVYLHFVKPGDVSQGQSRFISEVERVKGIVEKIGEYDVALFDELGSGTDLEGALYISELVTDNLRKSHIPTMLVTHLREFADACKNKGYRVMKARNYRFEEGVGSSEGKRVAEEHGLTQEFFAKTLRKK